jgi:hypothetical protein
MQRNSSDWWYQEFQRMNYLNETVDCNYAIDKERVSKARETLKNAIKYNSSLRAARLREKIDVVIDELLLEMKQHYDDNVARRE